MVSATAIQLCRHSLKAAIDNMSMNEHGCVPIKFYWWVLKFELYIVFMYHEVFFGFFSTIKKMQIPFLVHAPNESRSWTGSGLQTMTCQFLFWTTLERFGCLKLVFFFFFNLIEWHSKRRGHFEITWRIMIKKMLCSTLGSYKWDNSVSHLKQCMVLEHEFGDQRM